MLNIEKCHDMCIGKDMDEKEKFLQISSKQKMTNSKEIEVLEIKIDRKL